MYNFNEINYFHVNKIIGIFGGNLFLTKVPPHNIVYLSLMIYKYQVDDYFSNAFKVYNFDRIGYFNERFQLKVRRKIFG